MGYDIRDRDGFGEISVNHPNHICVVADMSSSTWNTVGTHEVFTVTGNVHLRMWAIVKQSLTSTDSSTMDVGVAGNTTAFLSIIDKSVLTTNAMLAWNSQASGDSTANMSGTHAYFMNTYQDVYGVILDRAIINSDIGYTINTTALTGGKLEFHCIWQPLSAGASVTAGSGGSL